MPTSYHAGRSYTDTTYGDMPFFRTARNGQRVPLPASQAGNTMFFGTEVEVDNFDTTAGRTAAHAAAQAFADEHLCHIEHDGSLNNGFEIVSAPMTLSAHKATDWTGLFSTITANGGKAHETRTCGLHVHVSRAALGNDDRAKKLALGKILEMVERFQPEFSALARRNIADCQWARPTGYGHSLTDGSRAIRRKSDRIQSSQGIDCHDGARYRAVNLQNRSTIEFRFFKGTLNADTFYATLALVDGLVRYCKTHTTPDIHSTTFDSFIQWVGDDKLTAYWAERKSQVHRYRA